MENNKALPLVIVGSIGLDTIETPWMREVDVLGGSVSYACAGASFFTPVGMVGVVGNDFPEEHMALYRHFGIDLKGLQKVPGKTFRWSGVYSEDMNQRRTLSTELNVFADFSPVLPLEYKESPYVFLANIAPQLQLHVLTQIKKPRFVLADTMDLWINIAREKLIEVIAAVHILTLNESEARLLAGEHNLVLAAQKIRGWGPDYVLIKKGEHGAMLFSEAGIFVLPAFPLEEVIDPTGAGDVFAGGMMGYLASQAEMNETVLRRAMVHGAIMASFGVQALGMQRLRKLDKASIQKRVDQFYKMITVN